MTTSLTYFRLQYSLGTAAWSTKISVYELSNHHPPPQPFYSPFSGNTRVSWCQKKKLFLNFMVLGRITRGRHTDNPGGRHSIGTNQQSTSINHQFSCRMPFLSQPSQFILTWDRHSNMVDCIPYGLVRNTVFINYATNVKFIKC